MAPELPCLLDTASKLALFSVSGLKVEKLIKKSKPTWKLKHANSILESFVYFGQISSKLILTIFSYTVSKLVHFLRHNVQYIGLHTALLTTWISFTLFLLMCYLMNLCFKLEMADTVQLCKHIFSRCQQNVESFFFIFAVLFWKLSVVSFKWPICALYKHVLSNLSNTVKWSLTLLTFCYC